MDEYITCPNCERYISVENIEAPCQLCGRDMCSACMRVCPDCGKEVCNNHWSHGKCTICYDKSLISSGYTTLKESEADGDKVIGAGMMVAGTVKTAQHTYKLNSEKERRRMGDEAFDKHQNLGAVFYAVFFLIFIPTVAISIDLWKHQGGLRTGDTIFLIFGSIFAVVAAVYARGWAENRFYSKNQDKSKSKSNAKKEKEEDYRNTPPKKWVVTPEAPTNWGHLFAAVLFFISLLLLLIYISK